MRSPRTSTWSQENREMAALRHPRDDGAAVEVARDHYGQRRTAGVLQDGAQLVAAAGRREVADRLQVDAVRAERLVAHRHGGGDGDAQQPARAAAVGQHELPVVRDGPRGEERVAEVLLPLGVQRRRVVDVVERERACHALGARRVHLLQRDHVGVVQPWLVPQDLDQAVDVLRELHVEAHDADRGRRRLPREAARVARPHGVGVVVRRRAGARGDGDHDREHDRESTHVPIVP
jgi:hypothetical protein